MDWRKNCLMSKFKQFRVELDAGTRCPSLMLKFCLQTVFAVLLSMQIAGCMPRIHPAGERIYPGRLETDRYVTADDTVLPLRVWLPASGEVTAVLIALHGFNDYSNFFQLPGSYLQQQGIASYAYDQRGFGGTPGRGLWAGVDTYGEDLRLFVQLIKARYPELPVYVLGVSMGAAVTIAALGRDADMPVDGVILVAPAVWARSTMPWYQRFVLWSMAHTLPWLTLTGESVQVMASDNIEMLRAFSRDPLVIKETRVEAIYGLTNLMDAAAASAANIEVKSLLLVGEKDEIIPQEATFRFLQNFLQTGTANKTVAFYQNGYHMLLRDCQAAVVWKDIAAWIARADAALPSGADRRAAELLRENGLHRQLAMAAGAMACTERAGFATKSFSGCVFRDKKRTIKGQERRELHHLRFAVNK